MYRFSLVSLVLLTAACSSPPVNRDLATPLTTVDFVDLDKYQGRWYEIARFPNNFEKNCEGVTADYGKREDGLISVVNTCRKGAPDGPAKTANGRARIVDTETNAKLEVSFFGPFWGDYWIIGLDEAYSLSLVGEPSGRYLWILSRTPKVEDATLQDAIATLRDLGYSVDALYFTKQPPGP